MADTNDINIKSTAELICGTFRLCSFFPLSTAASFGTALSDLEEEPEEDDHKGCNNG